MKKLFRCLNLYLLFFLFNTYSYSQVGIAINTSGNPPVSSSILDVQSTNQGILIPRMSDTQRDAVITPATGLCIYNTTTNSFNFYNGTSWQTMPSTFVSSTSGVLSPGTGVSINTSDADAHPSAILDISSTEKGFLVPRTVPTSIGSPAEGMIIYDTSTHVLSVYNGSSWDSPCDQYESGTTSSGSPSAGGQAINFQGNPPDPSAILDVSALYRGVLIPRMTNAQRNNLLPVAGLLIYNNESSNLEYWNGSGWYSMDPGGTKGFITEWTTTATNETITLPLDTGDNNATFNCTVDWGDGSTSTITSYNDPDRVHSYASADTYVVEITGTCEGWSFDNGGDKLKINKVLCWGDVCVFSGFKYLNSGFEGCANLTSIADSISASGDGCTGFAATFEDCNSLTSIPQNLFRFHPNVLSFSSTFNDCNGLSSLPDDLFRYNTLVSTHAFFGTFSGCSGLSSLPEDLFRYNTLIPDLGFRYTFEDCIGLISLPENLFRYNTHVSTYGFWGTFSGCSGLTSLPDDLFRYNTFVLSWGFKKTFEGCSGLTSLPVDLFKYNINVSTSGFLSTFFGCSGLTSLPDNLFKYNTLVSQYGFEYTFYGCSGLTSLPDDLFRYNTAVSDNGFSGTFNRCSGLTSLPDDLFRYNTLVSTDGFRETFYACSGLTSLPDDLFRYNTLVSTNGFRYTFYSCSGLTSLPVDLFRYNTAVSDYGFYRTFYECENLQLNRNIFFADGEEDTRFLDQSPDFTSCFDRSSFTGTQGEAPPLWDCDFGTGTPATTDCFSGAGNSSTSLSNYSDIPAEWK